MKLLDIYADELSERNACFMLFELLLERELHQSISHKSMPTFDEHCAFVSSRPYAHWYAVEHDQRSVGAIYLSKQREIGVGIFKEHQRSGHAMAASEMLMIAHPGPFLANMNPGNTASARLFHRLGFGLLQMTYAKDYP